MQGAPGGQVDIMDPEKTLRAIEIGHDRLSWARITRAEHMDHYVGRWYGNKAIRRSKPLNLLAQAIGAWLPVLALNHPKVTLTPRRAGLTMEGKTLALLENENMDRMDAANTIYRLAIVEALFAPLAPTYTGLRNGGKLQTVFGLPYDPGQPFTVPIDFDDWALDPYSKTLAGRRWEAHRIYVSKRELLESPAFADKADAIMKLNTIEEGARGISPGADLTRPGAIAGDTLSQTIEMWNVCFYMGDKILEGTVPSRYAGKADWLRLVEYEGPGGGPYDHLVLGLPVPSNAMSLSQIAIQRDIADSTDKSMAKLFAQVGRSKKVLGYAPAGKKGADKLTEAEDGESVKMQDPNAAKVFDLDMVSADLPGLIQFAQQGWNNVAGNPTLVGGTGRISNTAAEAEILNSRSSVRLVDMQSCVTTFAAHHCRKHIWFYQTDPHASYEIPLDIPGTNDQLTIPYSVESRQGAPEDFKYECDVRSMAGSDPMQRAQRLELFFQAMQLAAPWIQAGVITLQGFFRVAQREIGAEGFDEMLGDPAMIMQQLQSEMTADLYNEQAGSTDPNGPRTGQRMPGRTAQTMMPQPGGAPMRQQPNPMGRQPRPSQGPRTAQGGSRQQTATKV